MCNQCKAVICKFVSKGKRGGRIIIHNHEGGEEGGSSKITPAN